MAFLSTNSGSGDNRTTRFELNELETSIGRHPDCHIVVDAGAVSRFHAKVVRNEDQFSVFDLGSRNGTYLNDQLLTAGTDLARGRPDSHQRD